VCRVVVAVQRVWPRYAGKGRCGASQIFHTSAEAIGLDQDILATNTPNERNCIGRTLSRCLLSSFGSGWGGCGAVLRRLLGPDLTGLALGV
jgi:hypothetical protein